MNLCGFKVLFRASGTIVEWSSYCITRFQVRLEKADPFVVVRSQLNMISEITNLWLDGETI